jgi:hypothetical protein
MIGGDYLTEWRDDRAGAEGEDDGRPVPILLVVAVPAGLGGHQRWLAYLRRRDSLRLIKHLADSGKDIPAGLIDKLGRRNATEG